jgi:hypothetical protein
LRHEAPGHHQRRLQGRGHHRENQQVCEKMGFVSSSYLSLSCLGLVSILFRLFFFVRFSFSGSSNLFLVDNALRLVYAICKQDRSRALLCSALLCSALLCSALCFPLVSCSLLLNFWVLHRLLMSCFLPLLSVPETLATAVESLKASVTSKEDTALAADLGTLLTQFKEGLFFAVSLPLYLSGFICILLSSFVFV